jgi:hypothetical protein
MSLPVEWVCDGLCRKEKTDDFDVPVIRVATLRAWLTEQRDVADFYQKLEARAILNSILAQLPEA